MKHCDQGTGLNLQMIEQLQFPSGEQIKLTLQLFFLISAHVFLTRTPAQVMLLDSTIYKEIGSSAMSGGLFRLWDGRFRDPVFF